ncbi:MAG: endolytic transglycosylase MltG [Cytophagaceae bacterium]|nr:endolytic transglycosylase MltG [Cytophagaceae bacterium]
MSKKTRKAAPKKTKGGAFLKIPENFKVIGILLLIFIGIIGYFVLIRSNVNIKTEKYYVFIPAKLSPDELGDFLREENIIGNGLSFKVMCEWMKMEKPPKKGLYEIKEGWNNYQIINYFKTAKPIPCTEISIPSVRQRSTLLSAISRELNLSAEKLKIVLRDSSFLENLNGLDKESVYAIFIPGEYYIPNSAKEKEVVEIIYSEFLKFWNDDRLDKATDMDLSPEEATVLASIVYSETKNTQEMPTIAGVYLNRLERNMKLESDPTLLFASGNIYARRVYKSKKLIYPEYNTYQKKGLPPGPIHFPPPHVIDAVLNYEEHEYLYFCAKGDNSGCHLFAPTFAEHKINAQRYRKTLDQKKIYK